MVILSIIHATGKAVDEGTLFGYLRRLGFKENRLHPVFGEWKKVIEGCVRQSFLVKRTSDYVNSLTGKYDVLYEKGERAELELSAGQIMKFLGEVYDEEIDDIALKELELQENENDEDEGDDQDQEGPQEMNESEEEESSTPGARKRGRSATSTELATPSARPLRSRRI